MADDAYSLSRIRASLRAFAVGKVASATATVFLVFLLATAMPKVEYAAYVGAAAAVDLGLAIGTMGMQWLANTVIPRVRISGTATQLRRTIVTLGACQAVPYLVIGTLLYAAAPWVSSLMGGVVPTRVMQLYGIVLAIEGPARTMRDQMLSVLLLQGFTQMVQVGRMLVVIGTVAWLGWQGTTVTAERLAVTEMFASSLSGLIAVAILARYLSNLHREPGEASAIGGFFGGRAAVKLALHAHGSFLLVLSFSTEVLTAIVARFAGAEATAQFGFASRLLEQARKYLPTDLFSSVLGPALIGRYERHGRDFRTLTHDAALVVRANTLVVSAGLSVVLAVGNELIPILTHGQIAGIGMLLAVMLLSLYGYTLRRILELLVYPTGLSRLSLIGSLASNVVPLALVAWLVFEPDVYAVAIALLLGELVLATVMFTGLSRSGRPFPFDYSGLLKQAVAVALAALSAAWIPHWLPAKAGVGLGVVVALAVFGLACLLLRVITLDDLAAVRSLVHSRKAPVADAPAAGA